MPAQLRPTDNSELSQVWHREILQLFRQFRASQTDRELRKANTSSNDSLADAASRALYDEMLRLITQLFYIEPPHSKAISAIAIAAMSLHDADDR